MKQAILVILAVVALSGCSTRQEGSNFKGSTEQRLVTHSIHHMLENLKHENLELIKHQPVFIQSYFVIDNQVLNYANNRLKMELVKRFDVKIVAQEDQAKYKLDMFFTSLGTDRDSLGLSVPIVNLSNPEQSTVINILAVDMYHGIAEGNYYLTDLRDGKMVKKGTIKARVRTDKFATPIFSVPVSNIDDDAL